MISPPNQTPSGSKVVQSAQMPGSPPFTRKFRKWNTFCVVHPYSGTLHSILINWICKRNQTPQIQNSLRTLQCRLSQVVSKFIRSLKIARPQIKPAPAPRQSSRTPTETDGKIPSNRAILIDRTRRGGRGSEVGAGGWLTSATTDTKP